MDYATAMNYIEEKNKLGSVPGLDNVKELLRRLGNPQNRCRCLHIAGTNGKGSVFSFVQEILLEAGFSVGRYISPTIFTYLERFQINKQNMPEEDFAEILSVIAEKVSDMERDGLQSPTAFEIETAAAFLYFSGRRVDYALIECGMGGALDATNVICHPVMSVIASVSRDHMQFLGNTLSEIAAHKAGIIQADSVCISAPQAPEVEAVLRETCERKGSGLVLVRDSDIHIQRMDLEQTLFDYKGEEYCIKLLGEHQAVNAAVAAEAASQIEGVCHSDICRGLRNTVWSGRMTKVCDNPYVFVDGAHNEAAWKYLKRAVNKYFTNRRIIYIIGVLKDKEYVKMVDILADTMDYAVTVTPDTPRGLDGRCLAELIGRKGVAAFAAKSADDAVRHAMRRADMLKQRGAEQEAPVILVCGSLSFIADYLDYKWDKI